MKNSIFLHSAARQGRLALPFGSLALPLGRLASCFLLFAFYFLLLASCFPSQAADRWSFTIGPAMRSNMKTTLSGGTRAAAAGGAYEDGRIGSGTGGSTADWSGNPTIVPDPVDVGQTLYALQLTRSEASATGGSEDETALGLSLSACYDFLATEDFALGLRGSFGGWWNMDETFSGGSSRYTDTYLFENGPVPELGTSPVSGLDEVDTVPSSRDYLSGGPGSRTKISSDLYVLGLGPRAAWHATKWLDAYAGVEGLVGISKTDLTAGGASASDTSAALGAGGYAGLAAYIGYVGFYAQVGYEYLDPADVSAGGLKAETDFSGLTVSAGLCVRF